jgi:hypothetical protein
VSALLYGVSPIDAPTLLMVALLLGAAGTVACMLPGWSARRADPATLLRHE